ncbi:MAG: PHP domain-containing protein [Treponema sp.]|nr:PHP domain-containing protein [Treponema sp.]
MEDLTATINNSLLDCEERISALKDWKQRTNSKKQESLEINNHIHTIYSFSPYTPAMAVLKAEQAGLAAAGSVDHDSAAAAQEMIAACAVLGLGGCCGIEIRVDFTQSPNGDFFAKRKLNNPDSFGIAYITIQGIPSAELEKTAAFLKPIREARLLRSRKMTENCNQILFDAGFQTIDFENDVIQISQYRKGGEITERHLMAAIAGKIIERFGRGAELVEGLKKHFDIDPGPKIAKLLADPANPHYLYDLLGVFKTGLLPRIYIQPDKNECINAKTAVDFALSINAVPAYSYLGDIAESATGDKKAEKFEDDFLSELFEEIKNLGFLAITYMPPRNTPAQMETIRRCASEGNYMEISGVDINSSRQSFNCPEVLNPDCRHLLDTTWALIAHERLASTDSNWGLFSKNNPLVSLSLQKRIIIYAEAGKALDLYHPEESAPEIIEGLRKGDLKISKWS